MKAKIIKRSGMIRIIFILAALLMSVPAITFAQKNGDSHEVAEARKKAADASDVLREMMKKPDDFIPQNLLKKAEAIAIFPGVVKAAFLVGGRGGDGVVVRRTGSGWSMPIFYNMAGASFGPQIGVNKTDYIMLFMNEGAIDQLQKDKFEFGGDVAFAAGPVGRTAAAETDASLKAGILTYSRSKGAFVGASIKGAAVTPDNDRNMAVYGMKAHDLLMSPNTASKGTIPMEIKDFPRTVSQYAGGK